MTEMIKTIKIKLGAWRKLRKLAADSDEQLGEVVTRLIEAEWLRIGIADALGEDTEAQP